MSDYTKTWERLFGAFPTPAESQAERLLRDLERANALPEPPSTVTVTLDRREAYDILAAMQRGGESMGPCEESAVLAKFRQQLDEEMDS